MRRRGQPEFQVVHKRRPILRLRHPEPSEGREEHRAPSAGAEGSRELDLREHPVQDRPVRERAPADWPTQERSRPQGSAADCGAAPPARPVSSQGSFFAGLQGVDVERLRREAEELFADLPEAPVRQGRGAPVRASAPAAASRPVPVEPKAALRPRAADLPERSAPTAPDAGIEPVHFEPILLEPAHSEPAPSQSDLPAVPEAAEPPAPPPALPVGAEQRPVVRKARAAPVKRAARVKAAPLPFPAAAEDAPPKRSLSGPIHHEPIHHEPGGPPAAAPETFSAKPVPAEVLVPAAPVAAVSDALAEIDRLRAEIEAVLSERTAIDRARLDERRRHSRVRAGLIATISWATALLRPVESPSSRDGVQQSVMDLRP